MLIDGKMSERHYRIKELSELWGVGRETLRKLVQDEPGVVRIKLGKKNVT
jgi:hypothetical protein